MQRLSAIVFAVWALFFQSIICGKAYGADPPVVIHPLYLEELSRRPAYATVRDSQGYLWIASGNYLLRYDGYSFKEYQVHPEKYGSTGDERLNDLMLAPDGSIWIASTTLIQFFPQTETYQSYDVYTRNYPIEAIARDYRGILWLGGRGFDLVGFDPEKKEIVTKVSISHLDYQQAHTITAIASTPDKKFLWITSGSGVYRFNAQSNELKKFDIPDHLELGHKLTRDIIVASDASVWIASIDGIIRIDPSSGHYQQYTHNSMDENSISSNDVWSIFEDSKGQIWAGTDKKGVNKYRRSADNFQRIPSSTLSEAAFPASTILHIYEDKLGSLWFSTGFYGVRRVSEHLEKFINIQNDPENPNSLSFNNTLDMLEGENGTIWIATDGGGLNHFDPETNHFQRYSHDPNDANSLGSDSVISLDKDEQSRLWIGLWSGGVNVFNPKNNEFKRILKDIKVPLGQGLMNDNVFLTYVDEFGSVWINPLGEGLQIYHPTTKTFDTYTPKLSNEGKTTVNTAIYKILSAGNKRYWIGGAIGLELFDVDAQTFTRILPDEIGGVYDILQTGNTLWLATASKFIRYDIKQNTMKGYTVSDGLIHNNVTAIEQDQQGNFWLGTRGGLSRFNPVTEEFVNFDKNDGLAGVQFNPLSHLSTKEGVLYFGSTDGVVALDPQNIPYNHQAPQVVITEAVITRKSSRGQQVFSIFERAETPNGYALPYSDRNIAFYFSALSFISPKSNRYKYRLNGLDKDWNQADSSQRIASYTNLPPGRYTFQVLGSNNDGVWNNDAAEVSFQILPPWWRTWWAVGIFLFAFFGTLYLIVRWKMRFNYEKNKTLQLLVKEKNKNLELNKKLNRRITATLENERKAIAHEVHDNINSTIVATRMIAQSIERLSRENSSDNQKINTLAKKADTHLSETYDFFRALVRRLRPEVIETLGFEGAIAELIESYNSLHGDYEFILEVEGEKRTISEEVGIELYRIAQEAITNAIKHAHANKIVVVLSYGEKELCLSIRDNGKGFGQTSAPGLGIAHMRERTASINGKFSITDLVEFEGLSQSEPCTCIKVCVPV